MFGFGCSLCWDKNCSCTQEYLLRHKNNLYPKTINACFMKAQSDSYPKVSQGDIVFWEREYWFVNTILDGIAIVYKVLNEEGGLGVPVDLTGDYKRIDRNVFKSGSFTNTNHYKDYIGGCDPYEK